jgi:hypothetical protein
MAVIDELKPKLGIDVSDTSQDTDLDKIINRGKARLNDLTGVVLNFDTAGLAQDLLLDYCRYDYNNATEYFEENFQKEILRLQLQTAADALAAEMAEAAT